VSFAESLTGWVEVDLDAIRGNVRLARRVSGAAVMAVVKADGYGHGAVPVSRAALDGGARWLAVARAEEALELRAAGLDAPVLVLGWVPPDAFGPLIAAGVSLTVWSSEQIRRVSAAASHLAARAGVHVKVDTGMNRIGAAPADALDLALQAARSPALQVQGLFTHFACADELDGEITAQQQKAFGEVIDTLAAAGLRPPLVHAANSAGTLAVPGAGYDLVRFGIAMYGLSPGPQLVLPPAVRPALTWKTVLAQVKDVPAGQGVSYGHAYTTTETERIGTLPVGYADGWRRVTGNEVLIGGRRVPVRGQICMDQCMIGLDDVPGARVGDEAVLIGSQGSQRIGADDVADRWGTIGYEVVCGIGHRVPRVYLG
jgi:alanine racemase